MVLSTGSESSWLPEFDLLDRSPGSDSDRVEMYEENGEFALDVEMPGFEVDEVSVTWDDGLLYVVATTDEGEGRTYYRQFQVPNDLAVDGMSATYEEGTLEVRAPMESGDLAGTEIPVRS